jgi:hypothetical protein
MPMCRSSFQTLRGGSARSIRAFRALGFRAGLAEISISRVQGARRPWKSGPARAIVFGPDRSTRGTQGHERSALQTLGETTKLSQDLIAINESNVRHRSGVAENHDVLASDAGNRRRVGDGLNAPA